MPIRIAKPVSGHWLDAYNAEVHKLAAHFADGTIDKLDTQVGS